MLDLLRRQSVLIYAIFGAVILIFAVNFGPGAGGCAARVRPKQWVARVNGTTIGPELFGWALSRQYEEMRRRAEASGIAFDRTLAERYGIRRMVVDSLVDRRLVVAASEARGIAVSDERLQEELRDGYGVHEQSYAMYEDRVARVFNMTVEQFETKVRNDLGSSYLMHALRDAVDVTDSELQQVYVREHERLQLRYARLPIERKAVPTPGQEAIAALLEHEPGALQQEYDRDIEDFATPAMVRVSQVVRVLEPNAPAEEVAKATAELGDVHQQAIAGADFAALVEKFSQDEHSKAQGGDMGWLARTDVDPKLADAMFKLEVNALTEVPVRTKQGLHLLKKVEERAPGRKQLDEVRPELAARVLKGRVATAKAQQAAERLLAQLKSGQGTFAQLTRAAHEEGLKLGNQAKAVANKPLGYETSWLLRTDTTIASLGEAPQIIEAAFTQGGKGLESPGQVLAEPLLMDDAVVVVQLKVREHADLSKLKDDQEELHDTVLAQKRQRVLAAWLGQLRSQAKVDLNPAYLAPALPPAGSEGEGEPAPDEEAAG